MRTARLLALAVAGAAALAGGPTSAQDKDGNGAPWPSAAPAVPVRYKIEAELVETGIGEGVRIVGDETIFWTNTTSDAVKVLYLHTYANAFRNTRSTFLREALRDGVDLPEDMRYADLSLTRITVDSDPLDFEWRHDDDGNADDRTVVRVPLRHAVEQGAVLQARVEFTLDLPRAFRRMGTHHGFVMAAQWYPKLGRYLGNASTAKNLREGWYCHQYHASCEFAADFADYDVLLRFPEEFEVGATGRPVGADQPGPKAGVRSRTYRAESVVDFAWTADRRFVPIEREIRPVDPDRLDDVVASEWRRRKADLGLTDADAALPPVKVVLLLQPEHADQADRMFEAARVALGCFGTWLGPYPYGRLTIVDPPWASAGVGGMEYPMLVTAGTVAGSTRDSQRPEAVIVHEIGHQWLMALLASNEAEEAWLDEGINTYLTALALDLAYGPARNGTDILGWHLPYVPFHELADITSGWPEALDLPKWARPPSIDAFRLWCELPWLSWVASRRYEGDAMLPLRRSWLRRAGYDEMVKPGWTYFDRTSYAVNAYSRPALFLNSLRRQLATDLGEEEGDRKFFRALREYAREFRFAHPTTDDFLRKFKDTGADAAADRLVRGATSFDYLVESIRDARSPELIGFDEKGALHKGRGGPKPDADEPKRSIVRLRRTGDSTVPVVAEFRRRDGKRDLVRWDVKDQAKERWHDFTVDGEVTLVRIDPDGVYLQDLNLSNNSFTADENARPGAKWSVRFLGWLENSLLSYGRFF
jgi:peptidase M1-like protein